MEGGDAHARESDDILIYIDRKGTGRYVESDYYGWERPFLGMNNAVRGDFVHENQGDLIVHFGFFDLNELPEIRPNPGSVYIHSASEPHNEEQRIDQERLDNWLSFFHLPKFHVHASGHASGLDLMRMVQDIQPRKLIPIHTESPELFGLMSENVEYPELANM